MTDEKPNEMPTEDDVIFENEEESHSHKTKRHGRKNVGHKQGASGTWQFLTVLFAALFVLAVFTDTFDFMSPGDGVVAGSATDSVIMQLEKELDDVRGTASAAEIKAIEDEIDDLKGLIYDNAASVEEKSVEVSDGILALAAKADPKDEPKDDPKDEPKDEPSDPVLADGEPVPLEFYVMSQCPFGVQVEDAIAPVLDQLGENVDFQLYFIANDNGDGTFRSLHGEPEVQGNIVQTCAIKYEPDTYMDLVVCMNKDVQSVPDNWEACAEDLGMDVESITECYEGDEGVELFKENIAKAAEVGATGSPTIYLNGERYSGGRGEMDFMRALCDELEYGPQACQEIPEPTTVNIIVLNDERCEECDLTQLMGQLESIFPGMDVTEYDYNTEEGKELYTDIGVEFLPVILFDETVEGGEGYANVEQYLIEAGDYMSLRIGAAFDPAAEICNNEVDDTGNGKVDCEDDSCKATMECREEIDQQLQVFIMSDCPFGRKAVEALKEASDNFGDAMDYEVHYIANEAGDGFASLHGQYEVDENIIQLCVKEHSPAVWMDYIYCRSTKGVKGIDWTECAEEVGVLTEEVQTCFDGDEGADLLREDIKVANALGIGASPTWLANNRYQFSGIDAETVKTNFCKYNPDIDGCDVELSSDTGGVPAGSC